MYSIKFYKFFDFLKKYDYIKFMIKNESNIYSMIHTVISKFFYLILNIFDTIYVLSKLKILNFKANNIRPFNTFLLMSAFVPEITKIIINILKPEWLNSTSEENLIKIKEEAKFSFIKNTIDKFSFLMTFGIVSNSEWFTAFSAFGVCISSLMSFYRRSLKYLDIKSRKIIENN